MIVFPLFLMFLEPPAWCRQSFTSVASPQRGLGVDFDKREILLAVFSHCI